MWRGAKTATEEGLLNAAFLRCRIEFIEWAFAPGEVSEIWITFPDPQIKSENKRLTSPAFIERYKKFLLPGGVIRLKTDSSFLYEYTLDLVNSRDDLLLLEANDDIYGSGRADEILSVKTRYESQFLAQGYKIHLLEFAQG
jgi:tRNA (guanine-N7-)-methyltransferase